MHSTIDSWAVSTSYPWTNVCPDPESTRPRTRVSHLFTGITYVVWSGASIWTSESLFCTATIQLWTIAVPVTWLFTWKTDEEFIFSLAWHYIPKGILLDSKIHDCFVELSLSLWGLEQDSHTECRTSTQHLLGIEGPLYFEFVPCYTHSFGLAGCFPHSNSPSRKFSTGKLSF